MVLQEEIRDGIEYIRGVINFIMEGKEDQGKFLKVMFKLSYKEKIGVIQVMEKVDRGFLERGDSSIIYRVISILGVFLIVF